MLTVLVKAAALIAIIAVGYGIKRLGWVTAADFPLFSKIVLKVTLPCALATSFNDFEVTTELLFLAVIGVCVILVQQVSAWLIGRRAGRQEQAFGVINIASYNMGAFATPYLAGFMGPQAVVYASLFDVGNAIQAAGFGYAWSMSLANEHRKTTLPGFVKQLFSSVIFDTYLFLVVLRLARLHLPSQIITFTATVGSANTFLAMLMIGIGLEIKLHPSKYAAAARWLGIRYGYSVVFALATWFLLPVAAPIRTVLCMVYFAPIASMAPGFTSEFRGDVELSTFMTSVSILIGIVAMPIILGILGTPV